MLQRVSMQCLGQDGLTCARLSDAIDFARTGRPWIGAVDQSLRFYMSCRLMPIKKRAITVANETHC
jgi:hypothetical protein